MTKEKSKLFEPTSIDGIVKSAKSGKFYLRDTVYVEESDGTLRGVPVTRSLKTKSITEAKDRANRLKNRITKGEASPLARDKVEQRDFSAAFDLVLKIQSTKAAKTFEQTKLAIDGHLRPWFCGRKADTERGLEAIEPHCPSFQKFEKTFEEVWADYKLNNEREFQDALAAFEDHLGDYRSLTADYEIQVKLGRTKIGRKKLRQPKKPKKPTIRKMEHDRRYLIMALRRAYRRGWIQKEFKKKDFELSEVTDPIGKYVSDQDVQKLIDASRGRGNLHLQVLLAVYMGMRISEILHLQKSEINLQKREIDLNPRRVKTRKRREVPIPIADDVFPLLKKAYEEAPGEFVFPAWHTSKPGRPVDPTRPQDDNSYWWDAVREGTGIDVRFHDLRHTAITNMLKAGMPDFSVRKVCGVHESTMRRIYAHIEGELQGKFRKLFCKKFVI